MWPRKTWYQRLRDKLQRMPQEGAVYNAAGGVGFWEELMMHKRSGVSLKPCPPPWDLNYWELPDLQETGAYPAMLAKSEGRTAFIAPVPVKNQDSQGPSHHFVTCVLKIEKWRKSTAFSCQHRKNSEWQKCSYNGTSINKAHGKHDLLQGNHHVWENTKQKQL